MKTLFLLIVSSLLLSAPAYSADSLLTEVDLVAVFIDKIEIAETELQVRFYTPQGNKIEGWALLPSQPALLQIVYQGVLTAYSSRSTVDVQTNKSGVITRLELERRQ